MQLKAIVMYYKSIPQVSIDQRVTAPNELANVTGTVPKQFNSEYVSKKKLKFKRKESSEYKGAIHLAIQVMYCSNPLNESRQINPRQQRALSKKSSYLIKKFTRVSYMIRVKILNSIQKMKCLSLSQDHPPRANIPNKRQ